MSELAKAWIYGIVRHVLGGFLSGMAARGIVTSAQVEETLIWIAGAVGVLVWSLIEKYKAYKAQNPNGRPPASTAFMILFPLLVAVSVAGAVACKKPQPLPNEDAAVYKSRLKAVYAGQVIVAIAGSDAGIRILVDNAALEKPTAAKLGDVLKRAAITWKVVSERLEKGNDGGDTIKIIQNTITDIEQVEKDGAISLQGTQRELFYSITGGAKTSLAALSALVGGPGKPEPDMAEFRAQAQRARAQVAWVFDLSTLAFNTVRKMKEFSYFQTPGEAFAAGYREQESALRSIDTNIAFYKAQ